MSSFNIVSRPSASNIKQWKVSLNMMARHIIFFFLLVADRFCFIQVLEILILLTPNFATVNVLRQKQVSVMPKIRLRQIYCVFFFFSFCFRSVTSHNMLLNGCFVHAIVQIQHCCWTQIHGNAHGWVVYSEARGRIIRFTAGNEHRPSYRKIRKWRKRICNNNMDQSLELVFSICGKCLTKSKDKYPTLFLCNTVPLARINLRERVSVCSM